MVSIFSILRPLVSSDPVVILSNPPFILLVCVYGSRAITS